jgi:hypothetical protein
MNPCGGTIHHGGENGSPCGLRHLDEEGVHWRPKEVDALPFCAVVGVKGAAEGVVGDELMSSGYGGGKMICVRFD